MPHTRLGTLLVATALGSATLGLTQLSAAPAHAVVVTCHGHRATIVAKPGQTVINGTSHRDVIVGNHQQNVIRAGGGNDIVCGADNSDNIFGGPGQDRLFGQGGGDLLMGGPGNDDLYPGPGKHFANLLNGGPGDDLLVSVDPDDSFYFRPLGYRTDAPRVHVDLAAGKATGQGHDTLRLAAHPSPVVYVPPRSVVHGTPYDDELVGSDSVLYGGQGDDTFYSVGSRVHGGPGDDDFIQSSTTQHYPDMSLYGGSGDDVFYETVFRMSDHLTLDGGPGSDSAHLDPISQQPAQPLASAELDLTSQTLTAPGVSMPVRGIEGVTVDINPGVAEAFTLVGTDQPDYLAQFGLTPTTVDAGGGDDRIFTGDGDDTVQGGAGDDTADTGAGQDTCTSVEHPTECETVNP